MANKAQLAILRKGVKFWNKWRAEHPRVKIDLSDAELEDRKLRDINLRGANLVEANLFGADLDGADLREAVLSVAGCAMTSTIGHK